MRLSFWNWDDAVRGEEAVEAYEHAIEQWGEDAQLNKAAEEASELSGAINRLLNPVSDRDEGVIEEIIDARLSLEIITTLYDDEELSHRMAEQVADFRRRVEKDSPDGFRLDADGRGGAE